MHRGSAPESARLTSLVALALIGVGFSGCSESPTSPAPPTPQFAVNDGAHGGGVTGLYFLPPMVPQPNFTGTFDGDIASLNPRLDICDVTNGPYTDCGGATAATIAFTTTSTPAITIDPTTPQYQVNWDTKGTGFVAGHTYRLHVTAGAVGTRRELAFADVLLTTTPGQVKDLAANDLVVLKDGRTLPVHFRIETGIAGSLGVSAATASVTTGGTDLITATVQDLHGAALAGATVAWSVTTAPVTGVADATQPLNPTSGQTDTPGTTATTFKAGTTTGLATVTAASAGLSATARTAVTGNWAARSSMPTARFAPGVAVVNGILYAVGGGSLNNLAAVETYDRATNTWATKASMPTARFAPGVAAVNGILYAVGGFDGSPLGTVEAYDPVTNMWTTKASMPTARYGPGVAVVNGILYAVGGEGGGCCGFATLGTVEAYDPVTDTWTAKASMPTARFLLGATAVNGILYAVGGGPGYLGTVEAYDPVTNTWTTKASMPTARYGPGVAAVNGILYAVGGTNSLGYSYLATVEAYDPATNTWTTKVSMPTARYGLGVAAVNDFIYAVGGYGSAGYLATVEAYQP